MERLYCLLRRFKRDTNNTTNERVNYSYMGDICLILSWRCPFYTLGNFFILNLFLCMLATEFQIIGLVAIVVLLKFLFQYTLGSYVDTHLFAPTCEGIYNILKKLISRASLYRKECPCEFCFVTSVHFLTLVYLSNTCSGVTLGFIALWWFFVTSFCRIDIPLIKEKLEAFLLNRNGLLQADIQEEDLFPLPIETRNDDNEDLESLATDRTADSVSNSLISGITSMPSFLDADDNQEITEEDLIPTINSPQTFSYLHVNKDHSSDSESDTKDMQFKESQFNKDDSSEEEGAFEEGLHFEESQNQTQEEQKGVIHNIVDYVTSSSGIKMSNIFINSSQSVQKANTKNISKQYSSSDEEFEIIDIDELK